MSQDNLFNFQPTTGAPPTPFTTSSPMFPTDMSMQFAPSVPHRQAPSSQRSMLFHNPNQDAMMQQHQQFMHAYPGSPYDRPESIAGASTVASSIAAGGKQLQSKAERRAEHNAIERARRESLNVKFQQLAFTLPNLQNDTRPSKSTIIDRTLDFVKNAIQKEERYQRRIAELEKFNSYLLSESDKRLQHKKSKKHHSASRASSPVMMPPPMVSSTTHQASNNEESNEEEDDEDEDEVVDESSSTQFNTNLFQQQQQQQTKFSPASGLVACSSSSNHLPVSQPSVTMMPNRTNTITTNWPTTNTNTNDLMVIHPTPPSQSIKEEPMPFFQLQQQALMIQKFQDHNIGNSNPTEQEAAFHSSMAAHNSPIFSYSMSNNNTSFMDAPVHHFMHRH